MTPLLRSGPRPTPPAARVAARLVLAGTVAVSALGGCGSDDSGDLATFCQAMADVRAENPFAELDLATPAEMRAAFDALADGADRIVAAAPDEVELQAERYREAVEALRDELAGGGYDPTRVDDRRYGRAVEEYTEAAGSLDNAADARC